MTRQPCTRRTFGVAFGSQIPEGWGLQDPLAKVLALDSEDSAIKKEHGHAEADEVPGMAANAVRLAKRKQIQGRS